MNFFKNILDILTKPQKPTTTIKPIEVIPIQTPYEYLQSLYKQYGATWNEVNIFGIRNEVDQDKDIFNDYIGLAINNEIYLYKGTCDPGKYWTEQGGANTDKSGVAHLCLGFHSGIWQVGIHLPNNPNVAHEALIQTGNTVKIWRDKNKNYTQDSNDVVQKGYFGINCHRSNAIGATPNIGLWSAGCQVFSGSKNFQQFMDFIKNSQSYIQNNKYCFSYFLFDIKQIDTKKLGI
jgi:hypothetical protein